MKKEDEFMGGVDQLEVEKKKKKKAVEIGESSRGAALKKKKAEKHKPSKRKKVKYGVPRFKITLKKSYLKILVID